MPYDSNDYQPGSGKVVKTDGTIVNEGDGYNTDGSQNNVMVADTSKKVELIGTIPAGAITAGQTLFGSPLVDASKYTFISATIVFAEAPTACTIAIQEGLNGNDATNMTSTITAQTVVSNSIYLAKANTKIGNYIRYRIQNSDTVTHNITGGNIYGWRA